MSKVNIMYNQPRYRETRSYEDTVTAREVLEDFGISYKPTDGFYLSGAPIFEKTIDMTLAEFGLSNVGFTVILQKY